MWNFATIIGPGLNTYSSVLINSFSLQLNHNTRFDAFYNDEMQSFKRKYFQKPKSTGLVKD